LIATHSLMELSPSWEAAHCAATQELPSILWNPEVHHRVHISPPPVPILSQIDPIPTIPSYVSKIHFNIVQPSTSWSLVLIQVQFQNTCKCVCSCRLQVTSSVFFQYYVCWSHYCDTCFPWVCFAEWLAHLRTERRLAGNSNLREQVMLRVQYTYLISSTVRYMDCLVTSCNCHIDRGRYNFLYSTDNIISSEIIIYFPILSFI
jgi:hypothetical protein